MKKTILITLIGINVIYSQMKIEDVLYPSLHIIQTDDFITLTLQEINKTFDTLEMTEKEQEMYSKCCLSLNDQNAPSRFYKYDISGDGQEDIIYYGHLCGSEEMSIQIWIKDNAKYYNAGTIYGTILKLFPLKMEYPLIIITLSNFCCDSYNGDVNYWKPSIMDSKIKYSVYETSKLFAGLTLPEKTFEPIRFSVKNNIYKLRLAPEINDTIEIYNNIIGNTLAEYKKGSVGSALAESIDETGRVWWFVKMDIQNDYEFNRFYSDKGKYKCGWMSSRYLEVAK